MSGQIHSADIVQYWRVGVLYNDGRVETVCSVDRTSEASSVSFARNISAWPSVRETWLRAVCGGYLSVPMRYYRNGEQVR